MPIVDGPTVFKTIRSDETSKNHTTPCIVLTADALSGSESKYLDMGFDAYLSKPIEGDKLKEIIREFLKPENMKYKKLVKKSSGMTENILKALEEKDYKNYMIMMHKVKTGLKSIGEEAGAASADRLESAARAAMKGQDVLENETLLSKETKVLLEEYDRVTEKAKEILETTDND